MTVKKAKKRAWIRYRFRFLPDSHPDRQAWEQKFYRKLHNSLKPGTLFETCGCDVAIVTRINPWEDHVGYVSVLKHPGGEGNCSFYNCGPRPLTPEEVRYRIQIFTRDGEKGLTMRYYVEDCKMSEQDALELLKKWT